MRFKKLVCNFESIKSNTIQQNKGLVSEHPGWMTLFSFDQYEEKWICPIDFLVMSKDAHFGLFAKNQNEQKFFLKILKESIRSNKIWHKKIREEGVISNAGSSKTASSNVFWSRKTWKRQVRKKATVSSNLVSKTAISKMVLGTKSYLHYKPSHRCLWQADLKFPTQKQGHTHTPQTSMLYVKSIHYKPDYYVVNTIKRII